MSKLSLHPNIISYYDSFEVDGTLMIEMEYADGGWVLWICESFWEQITNKVYEESSLCLEEEELQIQWDLHKPQLPEYVYVKIEAACM